MLDAALAPQRQRVGGGDGVGVAPAAAEDHVAAVGQQRPMAGVDHLAAGAAERGQQPLGIRDDGVGEARHVVAGDVEVSETQHLRHARIGVGAVVLHVDDDQRRLLPGDVEARPRHVPARQSHRRVDRLQIRHYYPPSWRIISGVQAFVPRLKALSGFRCHQI